MSFLRSLLPRLPLPSTRMSSSASSPKKYFLLSYKYVDNVVEKRAPLRSDHLELAKKYVDSGKVLLGGAFADPIDGAAIVFQVDEKREVEDYLKLDPYVIGKGTLKGVVEEWNIREWTVVVGSMLKPQ